MSRTKHHGKRYIRLNEWWDRWWAGPNWWHRLTTGRRKKAQERELLARQKLEPEADLAYPLGNRKPHNYFY